MRTKAVSALLGAFLTVVGVLSAAAPAPAAGGASGQPVHRVVFEVTSTKPEVWHGVLNNVENLRKALGADTQVELVAHGGGLSFLLGSNTAEAERMKQLASTGVVFAACRNTMQRQGVSAGQLLPFATTVDSGVAEIVRRQEQGWAYIRTGE